MIKSIQQFQEKRIANHASISESVVSKETVMDKIRNKEDNIQCSAEGHVSHVFADRMSARPLGWSEVGVDNIARLRVYKKNKGNIWGCKK